MGGSNAFQSDTGHLKHSLDAAKACLVVGVELSDRDKVKSTGDDLCGDLIMQSHLASHDACV